MSGYLYLSDSAKSTTKPLSSEQATRVYVPQTQDWYYLLWAMNASASASRVAVLLAATPPVQEAPLFADDTAERETLLWQVLIRGAAIGCVATTCLLGCLSTIFFALSTHLDAGTTFKGDNPEMIRF